MSKNISPTSKEARAAVVRQRLERAQAEAEVLELDFTPQTNEIAEIDKDLAKDRNQIKKAQDSIIQLLGHRHEVVDQIAEIVLPYLERGAGAELCSDVCGLSVAVLRSKLTRTSVSDNREGKQENVDDLSIVSENDNSFTVNSIDGEAEHFVVEGETSSDNHLSENVYPTDYSAVR